MNVDTYNATPLHESVGQYPSKGPRLRVFNDGSLFSPLWFELAPDLFWNGADLVDARDTQEGLPKSGVNLGRLQKLWPKGILTHQ